jgi:hypothetical protein
MEPKEFSKPTKRSFVEQTIIDTNSQPQPSSVKEWAYVVVGLISLMFASTFLIVQWGSWNLKFIVSTILLMVPGGWLIRKGLHPHIKGVEFLFRVVLYFLLMSVAGFFFLYFIISA